MMPVIYLNLSFSLKNGTFINGPTWEQDWEFSKAFWSTILVKQKGVFYTKQMEWFNGIIPASESL